MSEVTFKPYQKVLVRDTDKDKWRTNWFSHLEKDESAPIHVCVGHKWIQCIPYEGNEHLLGTTDSPTPPKAMFEWGEHVEVRDYSDENWKPAIFLFQTPDKVWQFHAILKDAMVANGYAQCRHADW